jgi:hypothetical protein
MADLPDDMSRQIHEQYLRVRGLQEAVYSQPDPAADTTLRARLAQAEADLNDLRQRTAGRAAAAEAAVEPARRLRLLGPETTGLRVEAALRMQPLPTGFYNLLDPKADPLLEVSLENKDDDKTKRVRVQAYLEGLSARHVQTVEIKPEKQVTLKLLPTLLPARARKITEVMRATLHLVIDDLDGAQESHDTFSVVCLARTSSINAVHRPDTGQWVDLSHYYGAWVTPYVEAVQERVRRAASLWPAGQLWGYQAGQASSPKPQELQAVTEQVAALYRSLREAGIVYVNSVIDFGAPPGLAIQRTRLPRESLRRKSANCIDGTVLLASLLEGASLNPALVFVPGHAFVAWETWRGTKQWEFLETTMIGTHDFDVACQSGRRQYEDYSGRKSLTMHSLVDLRARGIWPME